MRIRRDMMRKNIDLADEEDGGRGGEGVALGTRGGSSRRRMQGGGCTLGTMREIAMAMSGTTTTMALATRMRR